MNVTKNVDTKGNPKFIEINKLLPMISAVSGKKYWFNDLKFESIAF